LRCVVEDHAHRPFFQLRWISLLCIHGSILSDYGASRKVGAVHLAISTVLLKKLFYYFSLKNLGIPFSGSRRALTPLPLPIFPAHHPTVGWIRPFLEL
ncbi:MAG: hypothetical protein AB1384_15150, partial [Actinomycetota bacterium]